MLARCRQHLMRELKARTLDAQRACTRIPSQHYTQARENTVDQVQAQGILKTPLPLCAGYHLAHWCSCFTWRHDALSIPL